MRSVHAASGKRKGSPGPPSRSRSLRRCGVPTAVAGSRGGRDPASDAVPLFRCSDVHAFSWRTGSSDWAHPATGWQRGRNHQGRSRTSLDANSPKTRKFELKLTSSIRSRAMAGIVERRTGAEVSGLSWPVRCVTPYIYGASRDDVDYPFGLELPCARYPRGQARCFRPCKMPR